jgi:DMSO/TMAO reductase YedYZ molybdopterin-dependent catalytic subunit
MNGADVNATGDATDAGFAGPRETDPDAPRAPAAPRPAPWWSGPAAGLASGAVAVGLAAVVAALMDVTSPIDAVGSEFIARSPGWLARWAIDVFGHHDKQALRTGIYVVLAIGAVAVGALGRRWRWVGVAGIGAFGLVGMLAALHRPNEPDRTFLPSLVGAVAGIAAIWHLLALIRARPRVEMPTRSRVPLGWDRRRFLVTSGTATAVAVVAGGLAHADERHRIDRLRDAAPSSLPPAADRGLVPTTSTDFDVGTPYITPNDDFYRIDTAFAFPRINLDKYSVEVKGMVDRPMTLSYADLLARPQVERTITLACVSNEVGGDLIGNAVWQGVLLADVLREAGVQAGVEQVFGTSVDGFTCGFPVELALDGRDAMIAVGMNGKPLPIEHGFPARTIVPGLYGYVSGTKWLQSIELTTWKAAKGYWIPRGWSRDGPIKTESRIDVPRLGSDVPAGRTTIAGVAWAQHRGVAKVEVRVDDGEWREARLGQAVSDDTWCQWLIDWDATPGRHVLQVRATDTTGATQTDEVADVVPDGATGWHTRRVTVR